MIQILKLKGKEDKKLNLKVFLRKREKLNLKKIFSLFLCQKVCSEYTKMANFFKIDEENSLNF